MLSIIGIAMVVLRLYFTFYFQIPLNSTSTNIKIDTMLKTNDILNKLNLVKQV